MAGFLLWHFDFLHFVMLLTVLLLDLSSLIIQSLQNVCFHCTTIDQSQLFILLLEIAIKIVTVQLKNDLEVDLTFPGVLD